MQIEQIPMAKTHLRGLKASQRFESYRATATPLCAVEPLRGEITEDARCEGWCVDDLLVCRTAFSPTLFRRSARQAMNGGGFLLQINFDGEQRGEVDGHPLKITEDRFVLQDIARPYSSMGHVRDSVAVLIPRHRIQNHERFYRRRPVVDIPVASARGQILLQTLQSVVDLLPELTKTSAAGVASSFVGLLNGVLSAEPGLEHTPAIDEACVETMKAHLVRHLHEPGLSVETLCKAFHCSRAKVYRLFAEEGGVAAFIRQKRLLKCFEQLHRAGQESTVQEVAERWGFQDPYHFSRLFKKTFDVPPSQILRAAISGTQAAQALGVSDTGRHSLRGWLREAVETTARQN
ncbi:MAG: helix-turn-helix domain-containing protein [Acidobacteriota bacterium]